MLQIWNSEKKYARFFFQFSFGFYGDFFLTV